MKYESLISQMTLEEKCSLLSGGTQFTTKSCERLGIKPIFLSDGPNGVRKQAGSADHLGLNPSVPATCYPVAATVANSWDVNLAEQIGQHLGKEAYSQGVSVLLGPGLNIKRNPLCGRNFEYFSEDPYLSGKMAAAYIKGIQSENVAASPKHFAVNSQETFRMASDSIIDERALREIYLTGFEIAVKEGAPKSLMSSYNLINGEYANDSEKLLQEILVDEWGFDGFVVTDWGGSNDRVQGLIAGNHLEMPATKGNSDREIIDAVKNGTISEKLVDKRVDELLSVWMDIVIEDEKNFDIEAHHEFARKTATESIVLLKNEDNILPINKNLKVAVIGDFAENPRYQGAGSSLVNSTKLDNAVNYIKENFVNCMGYAQGFERDGSVNADKKTEAINLAKKADIVLLYMGLDEIAETEGLERKDMKLHKNQIELLKDISEVNPNVVVILSAGAAIEMPWSVNAKGILHGYLGGQAGAGGMVDILTGKVNPSGKLAESYPISYNDVPCASSYPSVFKTTEYRESIYVGYRYYEKNNIPLNYAFGYGLSYTTFEYSDLKISEHEASFTIKNTGDYAGAEIAQLYVGNSDDAIFSPVKELKGFAKVFLNPQESREVKIPLDDKTFRYFNVDTNKFEIIGGEYSILIGASSTDIRLTDKIQVEGTGAVFPYNKSELSSYFSGKTTLVSEKEFECLIKRTLPPKEWDKNAPIGRNQPIASLEHAKSGLGRLVFKVLNSKKNKADKKGKPDLNILFIYNMPFRGIEKMMGGMIDKNMVNALLVIVNGNFFKGVRQLFSAWRKMKKGQKTGIR